jgi:hypothetical protein
LTTIRSVRGGDGHQRAVELEQVLEVAAQLDGRLAAEAALQLVGARLDHEPARRRDVAGPRAGGRSGHRLAVGGALADCPALVVPSATTSAVATSDSDRRRSWLVLIATTMLCCASFPG